MWMTLGRLRRLLREASEPAREDPELAREENEWDELISIYSDMYKERHGIRPRWAYEKLRQMSLDDLRAEVDRLADEPYDDDMYEPVAEPEELHLSAPPADDVRDGPVDPYEDMPSHEPHRQPAKRRARRH